ncbi:similar to Saccharomyces cerevisiae YGR113W DAM1 Essential subunit of the Dam1 complex [Geotrichum candidum]|uniref:DASH complex subunit DAM1 n=1 Tax=Geotrichum candidum TaxID=1173061 RepID=A0A0J9XGS6_GEOCN|nr:similar to Saccharomyces cerevisiae YGR113W DAM1 Essential subunit of the Dam1 complex [Geotrichum candidum]
MSATTPSHLSSRPTTPLRRRSQPKTTDTNAAYTLNDVLTEPLVELNDGLAMLDQNLQHLQLMHESITSFNESFSAFLFGIEMNAWCVEFPEAPNYESFRRERGPVDEQVQQQQQQEQRGEAADQMEVDKEEEYLEQMMSEDLDMQPEFSGQSTAVPKSRLVQTNSSTRIPMSRVSKIPVNSNSTKSKPASSSTRPKLPATPWR